MCFVIERYIGGFNLSQVSICLPYCRLIVVVSHAASIFDSS